MMRCDNPMENFMTQITRRKGNRGKKFWTFASHVSLGFEYSMQKMQTYIAKITRFHDAIWSFFAGITDNIHLLLCSVDLPCSELYRDLYVTYACCNPNNTLVYWGSIAVLEKNITHSNSAFKYDVCGGNFSTQVN